MTNDRGPHEPHPPEDDVPEPQRRSGALAGIMVALLVVIMVIGVGVLWASPWDDDADQDPSLPGFQEDPANDVGDGIGAPADDRPATP